MAASAHSLSTCRIPLSALTRYYRRNLTSDAPPVEGSWSLGRRRTMCVTFDGVRDGTVVTVAEFAAHVAYLEPWTGTGLLVAPCPGTDVPALAGWSFGDVSRGGGEYGRTSGLSLQAADRAHALEQLDGVGWRLLSDDKGMVEPAGRTTDGRLAVCLYAERGAGCELVLEDLQFAITALHLTADLQHDS